MDNAFEILIYVLFIVASIGGSIYKNYIKKKEQELLRQKQIQNAKGVSSEVTYSEPEPYKTSIPTTIEDFLKKQFEIDLNPPKVNYEGEPTFDNEKMDPPVTIVEEGVAAFEKTSATLLSDNLNESDFSITSELNKQEELKSISDDEENAFRISVADEQSFNLKEAVIYSEILKRPYL